MRGERRGGEGRILVFYQKFLGEDTLTASQSKDLVFQEIRSGDGDSGRRAMMRLLDGQAVERLDQSSSRNLYGTEKENHGFCPTAAGPQPTGPHRVALFFFFFFFFSDRLRLGESFFSICFFYYAHSKVAVLLDNMGDSLYGKQPSNVSAALSSPKTFNKQGGLGTCNRAIQQPFPLLAYATWPRIKNYATFAYTAYRLAYRHLVFRKRALSALDKTVHRDVSPSYCGCTMHNGG